MTAHVACRPWSFDRDSDTGCFVVCAAHGFRQSFGSAHAVAHAACVEHNLIHHADERRDARQILAIVYESAATAAFTDADLQNLLTRAQARNKAFGVTGMLLAEGGWFLQALEGPVPIVENLMRTITADRRHRHLRIVSRELRQQRRFPDWAMAEGHIGAVEARPLTEYYEALLLARGQIAADARTASTKDEERGDR